jgi:hypothetical protein
MSFRENTAWISLVAMLGLMAWYFWPFLHPGQLGGGLAFFRLAIAAIVIVIISTVVRIAVAPFTPGEAKAPPDEREKMIETKGRRFSYAVLAWAVRLVCLFGFFDPTLVFNANTLLFFLMISEVFGFGYQIVQFRRGA